MDRTLLLGALLLGGLAVAVVGAPDPRAYVDGSVALSETRVRSLEGLLRGEPLASARRLPDPELVVADDHVLVKVTFVSGRSIYASSLGYFVYEPGPGGAVRIQERELIFPNASPAEQGGALKPGDASVLRDADGRARVFAAGTRLGFFLVADGWATGAVRDWHGRSSGVPSEDAIANAAPGRGVFTTVDRLNPEFADGSPGRARHALVYEFSDEEEASLGWLGGGRVLLVGFEDLHRLQGSDDDFDDLVFLVSTEPATAAE